MRRETCGIPAMGEQARRLMEQPPRLTVALSDGRPPSLADDRNRDEVLSLVALDHDEGVLASGCGCL